MSDSERHTVDGSEQDFATTSESEAPAHQGGAAPTSMMGNLTTNAGAGLLRRKLARRIAQRATDGDGAAAAGQEAPEAVSRAAGSSGAPLPAELRGRFEGSLGHSLDGVRVHTGGASQEAAESVGARAYTVGSDIHFGAGQYDPASGAGQQLLAHEVAHTVQQGGAAPVGPQHKLEVGSPDDALETEADAVAEAMVSGQPAAVAGSGGAGAGVQRATGAGRAGGAVLQRKTKTKAEWLTASAVKGTIGNKSRSKELKAIDAAVGVLEGILVEDLDGRARALAQVDKAIAAWRQVKTKEGGTAGNDRRAFVDELAADVAKEKTTALLALQQVPDPKLMAYVMKVMRAGEAKQMIASYGDDWKTLYHKGLRLAFDATGDVPELLVLIKERFGVEFAKAATKGDEWEKVGLTQCWDVFQRLPPAHVVDNPKLVHFLREKQATAGNGAGGWHGGATAAVDYDPTKIGKGKNTAADVGDSLLNVNRFDKVVRHEVGHALDAKLGLAAKYCVTDKGGKWESHADLKALAARLVAQSTNGKIRALADLKKRARAVASVEEVIRGGNSGGIGAILDKLLTGTDPLTAGEVVEVKADTAIQALEVGFSDKNPWYLAADGGVALADGRIYQQSYPRANSWCSYDKAARAKKVSTYQFRAPGEWIAEAYATYFDPGVEKDGAEGDHVTAKTPGKPPGELLNARDPDTKAWFDTNVKNA